MIALRCRPPGETASEVRIAAGLRRELPEWATGRATFALADQDVLAADPRLLPADWPRLLVRAGEDAKTLAFAERVLRAMAGSGLDRQGRLLALGGGTVCDLGGLCASLWLRGIELWLVPTTLLAMVDGSIGGKNAVNLPEGKNLAGTVHPPALVAIDLEFLGTLPDTEFRSGLGEVLKVALGLDAGLFELLERQRDRVLARDPEAMAAVVERCVAAKIRVVEADLRESGPRRLLNLGHTLGHALEAHSGFRAPHGLCVARGLHFALRLAAEDGSIDAADAARSGELLRAYGFPDEPLPASSALMPFLSRDKKVERGRLHFVLPTGIGRSQTRALPLERIAAALPGASNIM